MTPSASGQTIYSLVKLPGGDLLAGGIFTGAGSVQANAVARYNPGTNSWTGLGVGANSGCLTMLPLASGGGNEFAIGGYLSSAPGTNGTIFSSRATRFNASTGVWSEFNPGGVGVNTLVRAFTQLPDGKLVVGGLFTDVANSSAGNVGVFDPLTSSWSGLRPGTNGWVSALAATTDGDLIAGGEFTQAGGSNISRVARYTPSTDTWSALGSGITTNGGEVKTIVVLSNGDVIVGGRFSAAGTTAVLNIARYTPATSTWSALGSGLNGEVSAIAVMPNGDLVVGGAFTAAGSVAASRVARFAVATSTWSALGTGITGTDVKAIVVTAPDEVYVGGDFSAAGGSPARAFARYIFRTPCPGDFNCSGAATVQDVFEFIDAWLSGATRGNFNNDCCFNVQDVFDFLNAYFTPCQ